MAADLEQLGAGIILAAEALEPLRTAAEDGRDNRDALNIVDRGRAAIEAGAGRERRLQARQALLALQALDHRRLFAADVGAGAAVDEQIEVVARTRGILAEQPGVICLGDRFPERLGLADELAANVDVACPSAHRE